MDEGEPLHTFKSFSIAKRRHIEKEVDELYKLLQQQLDDVIRKSVEETFSSFFDYFRVLNGVYKHAEKGRISSLFLQGTCSDWNLLVDVCTERFECIDFFSLGSHAPSLDDVHERIKSAEENGHLQVRKGCLAVIVENVEALSDHHFLNDLIDDVANIAEPKKAKPVVLVLTSGAGVDVIYSKLSRHSLQRLETQCMTLPSPNRILYSIVHRICDFGFKGIERPLTVHFDDRLLRYVWDRYTLEDQSLHALHTTLLHAMAKHASASGLSAGRRIAEDNAKEKENKPTTVAYQTVFRMLVELLLRDFFGQALHSTPRMFEIHCAIQTDPRWHLNAINLLDALRSCPPLVVQNALDNVRKAMSAGSWEQGVEARRLDEVVKEHKKEQETAKNTGLSIRKSMSGSMSGSDYRKLQLRVLTQPQKPARENALKFLHDFFVNNLRPFDKCDPLLVSWPVDVKLDLFDTAVADMAKVGATFEEDVEGVAEGMHHLSIAKTTLFDAAKNSAEKSKTQNVKLPVWLRRYCELCQKKGDTTVQSEFRHDAAELELLGVVRAVSDDAVKLLHKPTSALEALLPNNEEYLEPHAD
ncbi:hypothetical protein AAVH_36255 [Aphelenchoides avenae]|nr:hypothetical protein AAVH_36255 [Aphelenchus avenae]